MKKISFPERCGAEYKRSLNHNYMVIRKPDKVDEDYQYSMVIQNDISGLLPMEERIAEGMEYIYYEISSMQPIGRIYEHKELDSITLESAIRGILKACRETEDYMIDFSRLVMDPACIFMSLDDGNIKFIFSPDEKADGGSLIDVAEFFLERISRTDAQAALMAYRFYQTVRKENYVVSDIERVLDECKREEKNVLGEDYHATVENTERIPSGMIETFPDSIDNRGRGMRKDAGIVAYDKHSPEKRFQPEDRKNDIAQKTDLPDSNESTGLPLWIPAVLATGALAGLTGIIPGIGDSKTVKLVALAVLIVAIAVLVKGVISGIKKRKTGISPADNKDGIINEKVKREENFDDFLPKKEHSEYSGLERNGSMDFDKFFSDMPERSRSQSIEDSGKTVFVEPDSDGIRNVLVDRKHGKEYEIDHFPYTIGKLQGAADLILNDRSVSRLHAGLFEENGHVYLQDYNSTNGTFLNGVQLLGEERAMLSAEDEVSIGKVCLEYR